MTAVAERMDFRAVTAALGAGDSPLMAELRAKAATLAGELEWPDSRAQRPWKYYDAATPIVKAAIKEAPAASTIYKFKAQVKNTSLAGPVLAVTDDIRVTLEIVPANLCFNATLATCVNKPTKDQCKP